MIVLVMVSIHHPLAGLALIALAIVAIVLLVVKTPGHHVG